MGMLDGLTPTTIYVTPTTEVTHQYYQITGVTSALLDPIVTDNILADHMLETVSDLPPNGLKKPDIASGETLNNQDRLDAIILDTDNLAQYLQGPISGGALLATAELLPTANGSSRCRAH